MSRDRILLGHGGGGLLTRELIEEVFVPAFDNPRLRALDDSAVVELAGHRLAFTTDSFVGTPPFFPGGDIGRLAVCGTVNDLAMQGAQPLWLSVGLILEEGFLLADLRRIIASMKQAAAEAGVEIVTGDTKVVERGHGDGLFINTSGVGRIVTDRWLRGAAVCPGDAVLVNGGLGEHGVAVLSRREGIAFSTSVTSDCAPLWPLVNELLASGAEIHALRDPTRGGLACAVCEVAESAGLGIHLLEKELPIAPGVQGACDLLGLDPLSIANEGKVLVFCRAADAAKLLAIMRGHPLGRAARIIGETKDKPKGLALLHTTIGGERIIDRPTGEDVPRIC